MLISYTPEVADSPNQQLPLKRDFFSQTNNSSWAVFSGERMCTGAPGWGGIYPPQLLSGYASIGKVVYNCTYTFLPVIFDTCNNSIVMILYVCSCCYFQHVKKLVASG